MATAPSGIKLTLKNPKPNALTRPGPAEERPIPQREFPIKRNKRSRINIVNNAVKKIEGESSLSSIKRRMKSRRIVDEDEGEDALEDQHISIDSSADDMDVDQFEVKGKGKAVVSAGDDKATKSTIIVKHPLEDDDEKDEKSVRRQAKRAPKSSASMSPEVSQGSLQHKATHSVEVNGSLKDGWHDDAAARQKMQNRDYSDDDEEEMEGNKDDHVEAPKPKDMKPRGHGLLVIKKPQLKGRPDYVAQKRASGSKRKRVDIDYSDEEDASQEEGEGGADYREEQSKAVRPKRNALPSFKRRHELEDDFPKKKTDSRELKKRPRYSNGGKRKREDIDYSDDDDDDVPPKYQDSPKDQDKGGNVSHVEVPKEKDTGSITKLKGQGIITSKTLKKNQLVSDDDGGAGDGRKLAAQRAIGESRKSGASLSPSIVADAAESPKPSPEDTPAPKKSKFPTIQKKPRLTTTGAPDVPSAPTTPKTSSPVRSSGLPSRPTPKVGGGSGDVDLNDEDEYAKLMGLKKTVPVATPTTAKVQSPAGRPNPKTAEERKKELTKAREDARKARILDWNPRDCFDMELPGNKMKEFEKKLRGMNRESYPNKILSAWQRRAFFKELEGSKPAASIR